MDKIIRIGTRESQLAVWQATRVQELLLQHHIQSQLVFIKSEGDIDLQTPLYEMGVQGIFTRSLDIALLNKTIDLAVHSMKDVPTQLPNGIVQAAVLERANYSDLLVYKDTGFANSAFSTASSKSTIGNDGDLILNALLARHFSLRTSTQDLPFTIATSSIRRKAQWLNRYPDHAIENLRGNVNTRLRKVAESNWNGAVFAAAGLERIGLRPQNSIALDWMLPAPAQGAIMVVCRETDEVCREACAQFNDSNTALCTKVERDFLKILQGGCSTPISALAQIVHEELVFKGNILSVDGKCKMDVALATPRHQGSDIGAKAAQQILLQGGDQLVNDIRNAAK